MKQKPISIMWFRRDLRLSDNRAFFEALNHGFPVLPIFIFDPSILDKLGSKNDARVHFIHQSLTEMADELKAAGKGLQVFFDTPANVFKTLFQEHTIEGIFLNRDYEPYAKTRDEAIAKIAADHKANMYSFKDQSVFEPGDVLKDNGEPYTVYTPFKNKWLKLLKPKDLENYKSENHLDKIFCKSSVIPSLKDIGFTKSDIDFPSKSVKAKTLELYDKQRNIPSLDGTSRFGLHLRFGTISARKCVTVAKKLNDVWLSELIWREFFMQILFYFPHVKDGAFRPTYDQIKWRNNKDEFKKWCDGMTGFLLVDAGMRELNATGYMHNRVRMLTASFLTKDLLIDWRWGEAYFAEKLLDFDLSANNGNWQWAAGTGCDAAPYFRIFNPDSQLEKFDPDFKYVKKWVPEYQSANYPKPMVDHSEARLRTLVAYKTALGK